MQDDTEKAYRDPTIQISLEKKHTVFYTLFTNFYFDIKSFDDSGWGSKRLG